MVSPPTATIDSVEDDEKTWKILVNLKPSDADLTERLEGLKQRLQEDFSQEAANVYWSDLTKRLVSLGFNYSNDPMKQDAQVIAMRQHQTLLLYLPVIWGNNTSKPLVRS